VPFVQNGNISIYYEVTGSGPALILGHSFLCSTKMWAPQIRSLSTGHTVINVDFRGHGKSELGDERFTIYDLKNDMLSVLDDIGVREAIWGGLSMGGFASLRAALENPGRVRGLMILDSAARVESRMRILKLKSMLSAARVVGMKPFMPQVVREMFSRHTIRQNPELVAEWKPRFMEVTLDIIAKYLHMLESRDDLIPRLSQIHKPTLVLAGEDDQALPVICSKEIADDIPDSKLVIVKDAGHLSTLEQPEIVTEHLMNFLDRFSV